MTPPVARSTATPPDPDARPRRSAPPIAGNIVRRLLGTTIRICVALISVPLYTRFIGMSQWGLLMLFQAAAAPIALLDLGTGSALVKYVAGATGRGDDEDAARSVRAALAFNAAVLTVGAATLLLLSEWFARDVFAIPEADLGVATRGFRFVAVWWAATTALGLFSSVLVARQRYDEVLRTSTLAAVASTSAGLGAAFVTRDASWVVCAQAGGTLVAAAFALSRVWRVLPLARAGPLWEPSRLRDLLRFGRWQTTASVGALLASWSDRYVLGAFFLPRTVGFYSLAQSLHQQAYALFFEAGDVLFPAVSHRHGMGELSAARKLALLAGWTLTSAFGPISATLAIVGGDFLTLWVSAEAAQHATTILRLLCAAGIAGLAGVAPIFFAMGIGRSEWQAPFSLGVGVVFTVASLLLVPRFGLSGIGYALLCAAAIRWILVLGLWRALFRSDVKASDFVFHIFAPPVTSLALLLVGVSIHDSMTHAPGWAAMMLEAAAVFVCLAALQGAVGEALPGGRARRRDVVGSFRPVVVRMLDRAGGRGSR